MFAKFIFLGLRSERESLKRQESEIYTRTTINIFLVTQGVTWEESAFDKKSRKNSLKGTWFQR